MSNCMALTLYIYAVYNLADHPDWTTWKLLFLSILLNRFVRLYKNLIQRSIIEKANLATEYQ